MKTTYNLTEIMSSAHKIRRTGKSMAAALTIAWAMAKLKNIENQMFMINMVDRWSSKDRELYNSLSRQAAALNAKINPPVQKILNPALTIIERADIDDRMTQIFMGYSPDWTEYKRLENELYVVA